MVLDGIPSSWVSRVWMDQASELSDLDAGLRRLVWEPVSLRAEVIWVEEVVNQLWDQRAWSQMLLGFG